MPRPLTVAVASGKGGTGKTLVATNLAVASARAGLRVTLVDCDVEAPNDALFLSAEAMGHPVDVPLAVVDDGICTACGTCRDACAYGALRILGGHVVVFAELCHGCGLCAAVCPTGAMGESSRRVGAVSSGPVDVAAGQGRLQLVTGTLDVGEVASPAVIRAARADASADGVGDLVILDAPPGVACAAVAAVRRADALLLVTEPTAFGLHDLDLTVRLGRDLGLPMAVVLNRAGEGDDAVLAYCEAESLPVAARIPFDRRIAETYAGGGLLVDALPEASAWFGAIAAAVGIGIGEGVL